MDRRSLKLSEFSASARYHLLTAMVVPRPIAWISTLNEDGSVNLAPFSFFNAICADPPLVIVGIGKRDGHSKDTARNLHRVPEAVIHLPAVDEAALVQASAAELPYGESEVAALGLELLPSECVTPPRVELLGIQLECRIRTWVEAGQTATELVILEILLAHVPESAFDERDRISVDQLRPLARLSSGMYGEVGKSFKV